MTKASFEKEERHKKKKLKQLWDEDTLMLTNVNEQTEQFL
jgi:hypothetical protein